MPWTSEEAQQVGRIEAKVDALLATANSHSERITGLETFANRVKGVLAFISLVGGILGAVVMMGCAHAHTRTYYPDGELKCNSATTVFGRGEVEVLVESDDCPDTIYESNDTGLSDNGAEAIGNVAEGLAAGAAKGVLP